MSDIPVEVFSMEEIVSKTKEIGELNHQVSIAIGELVDLMIKAIGDEHNDTNI